MNTLKLQGDFQTSRIPRIVIRRELLQQVLYLVKSWKAECQWFHRVDKILAEGSKVPAYHIYDLFIPPQVCSGSEVESDPEMVMKLYQEIRERAEDDEQFNKIVANTGVWCHSHVSMPVHPSGTDRETFQQYIETSKESENPSPQLMLIFNKKDEVSTCIWDPQDDVEYSGVPIDVIDSVDYTYVKDALENKLEEKKLHPVSPTPHQYIVSGSSFTASARSGLASKKKLQVSPGTRKTTEDQVTAKTAVDYAFMDRLDLVELESCLSKLVKQPPRQARETARRVLKELEFVLTEEEFEVLNILLYGTQAQMDKLLTKDVPLEASDESYSKYVANVKKQLVENLATYAIPDVDTLLTAVYYTICISQVEVETYDSDINRYGRRAREKALESWQDTYVEMWAARQSQEVLDA